MRARVTSSPLGKNYTWIKILNAREIVVARDRIEYGLFPTFYRLAMDHILWDNGQQYCVSDFTEQ